MHNIIFKFTFLYFTLLYFILPYFTSLHFTPQHNIWRNVKPATDGTEKREQTLTVSTTRSTFHNYIFNEPDQVYIWFVLKMIDFHSEERFYK